MLFIATPNVNTLQRNSLMNEEQKRKLSLFLFIATQNVQGTRTISVIQYRRSCIILIFQAGIHLTKNYLCIPTSDVNTVKRNSVMTEEQREDYIYRSATLHATIYCDSMHLNWIYNNSNISIDIICALCKEQTVSLF